MACRCHSECLLGDVILKRATLGNALGEALVLGLWNAQVENLL